MKTSQIAFVDVDTQFDFMDPQGHLYVPGAETLVPQLQSLLNYAQENGIPVVASGDAHLADDPEFKIFPSHCVAGTLGQEKIAETRLPNTLVIPNELKPLDLEQADSVLLEKTVFDLFGNPNAEQVFSSIGADEYVVFGVATDYCVRAAALGLRQRGHRVKLVTDAIKAVTPESGEAALQEMQNAGVEFVTTAMILGRNL